MDSKLLKFATIGGLLGLCGSFAHNVYKLTSHFMDTCNEITATGIIKDLSQQKTSTNITQQEVEKLYVIGLNKILNSDKISQDHQDPRFLVSAWSILFTRNIYPELDGTEDLIKIIEKYHQQSVDIGQARFRELISQKAEEFEKKTNQSAISHNLPQTFVMSQQKSRND